MARNTKQQTIPEPAHKDDPVADHHYNKLEEIHQELIETTEALCAFYASFDTLVDHSKHAAPRILKLIVDDLGSLVDDIHRHLEALAPIRNCDPGKLRGPEEWETFWSQKINNLLEIKGGVQ